MNHQSGNRRLGTSNAPQGNRGGIPPGGSRVEQPLQQSDNDGRNYKLILDPALGQGKEKVIRYNGGEMSIPVVDPRPRISRFGVNRHNINLKVPEFVVDEHFVGKILPKEITITNLNNNINQAFLLDMCKTFGDIRSAVIFYHPKTKKHLGIAKVLFSASSAAQKCIEKLHQTSKMGNIINVFADPSGEQRQRLLNELTTDKVQFRPPSPKGQLPANIMESLPPSASATDTKRVGINHARMQPASSSSSAIQRMPVKGAHHHFEVGPDRTRRPSSSSDRSWLNGFQDDRSNVADGKRLDAAVVSSIPKNMDQVGAVNQQDQNVWNCAQVFNANANVAQFTDNLEPSCLSWDGLSRTNGEHETNSVWSNTASWQQSTNDANGTERFAPSSWTENLGERKNLPNMFINADHGTQSDGYNRSCSQEPYFDPNSQSCFEMPKPPQQQQQQERIRQSSFHHAEFGIDGSLVDSQNSQLNFAKQKLSEICREQNLDETSSQIMALAQENLHDPFAQQNFGQIFHQLSLPGTENEHNAYHHQRNSAEGFGRQVSEDGFRQTKSQAAAFRHENTKAAFRPKQNYERDLVTDHFGRREPQKFANDQPHRSKLSEELQPKSAVEMEKEDWPRPVTRGDWQQEGQDWRGDPKETWQKTTYKSERRENEDQQQDVRKTNSHMHEDRRHESGKHGSSRRHEDGSRHKDRRHDGHERHRHRHKKHRRHHRSISADDNSRSSLVQSAVANDQQGTSISDYVAKEALASAFVSSVDDDGAVAEPSSPHVSLESRIQALLGHAEELQMAGSRIGFPPPLPPELPPPPLPPTEAEPPPPLPSEPAPPDYMGAPILYSDAVAFGVCQKLDDASIKNYGDRFNILKSNIMSRADFLSSRQGEMVAEESMTPVISEVKPGGVIDSVMSQLQYQNYCWYASHPPPTMTGCLPLGDGSYGNLPYGDVRAYGGVPTMVYAGEVPRNGYTMPIERALEEGCFNAILDQVTLELKKVIVKDMQKKMVESTGFKEIENWWKNEENKEKQVLSKPTPEPTISKPDSGSLGFLGQNAFKSSSDFGPAKAPPASVPSSAVKPSYDTSVLLSSLFDNKDGVRSSFGFGGGLLGLRGMAAKLPSFRKKPVPPRGQEEEEEDDEYEEDEEEEEDEEDEEEEVVTFRGPRTPEESENEEEEEEEQADDFSSSLSSMEDELNSKELLSKLRPSRAVVYSSSSDDEGDDDEEMEEEAEEDEEEPEKEEDQTLQKKHVREAAAAVDDVVQKKTKELESFPVQARGKRKRSISLEDEPVAAAEVNMEVEEPSLDMKLSPRELCVSPALLSSDAKEKPLTIDRGSFLQTKEPTAASDESAAGSNVELPASPILVTIAEEKVEKQKPDKDLPSLPSIKPSHLVSEWLSALITDHPYSLSPSLYTNKKGRKLRFQLPVPDESVDDNLSDDTVSLTDSAIGLVATLPPIVAHDHDYCFPFYTVDEPKILSDSSDEGSLAALSRVAILDDNGDVCGYQDVPDIQMDVELELDKVDDQQVGKKRKRLSDMTNLPGSRELANILPPVVQRPDFHPRGEKADAELVHEFLWKGLDAEDIAYLRKQYDDLVQEDYTRIYWVNETHWVNHPPTFEPSQPRKKFKSSRHSEVNEPRHITGSARTEGYYKISHQAKCQYLRHTREVEADDNVDDCRREGTCDVMRKKLQQSRDMRTENRRWQNLFVTDLGDDIGGVLKFNKLEMRKKQLKFARSRIHDWGLFAMEPIAEGEMVIEYVGQVVRRSVADALEKRYEAVGIGSSYLFRVDHDFIIDATKQGNLSRFINHSCSPNCYAKIITVDSEKRIVIYSKRDIHLDEEITYDYKFPIEDEKIPCLCGATGCRGTLN